MNILFLTLIKIDSLNERGIYHDLLRKFLNEGHKITIITPTERREKQKTQLLKFEGYEILKVKTFNLQKTNFVEKGIGTLAIEHQFLRGVKKYFSNTKFDIVLYSTPPITFANVISYIKKKDNAFSYLLLKDIFPQNAVDMKMIKANGFLHQLFRKKEKKLYEVSDKIGCMSEANVKFVLENNREITSDIIEVNPNTIEPIQIDYSDNEKNDIRKKYELPLNKTICVYGGNLGKPQGIDFLLECIKANNNPNVFFLIVGSGTEYSKVEMWFRRNEVNNAKLLKVLPKKDYDKLLSACDIGLIFLHKDFTIPNFPSRLLSYLEMKLPVITATDKNSDIGDVVEEANCGYKVISGDILSMFKAIDKISDDVVLREKMGENSWKLLNEKYTVATSYDLIIKNLK